MVAHCKRDRINTETTAGLPFRSVCMPRQLTYPIRSEVPSTKKGLILRPLQIHGLLKTQLATFQDKSSKSAQAPGSAWC